MCRHLRDGGGPWWPFEPGLARLVVDQPILYDLGGLGHNHVVPADSRVHYLMHVFYKSDLHI
jgi:hypothetical protein